MSDSLLALFVAIQNQLTAAVRREEGQGMVEYVLILTVVVAIGTAIATTGIATTIGNKISDIVNDL